MNSADCAYFWNVMEGSWKVRRKYRETAMEKSKNKYEYAEYDVIRVIIVSFATAARLAEQRRCNGSRRGARGGLRRLLGGVPRAHKRVVAISGAHGVGAGVG